MSLTDVKALIFDVFGTVVDWRSSIARQCQELGGIKGVEADWEEFADAWRGQYRPFMDKVRSGELPWTNLDALHRMSLDLVLAQFGLDSFSEAERSQMNLFWHNLRPWPDSVPGLYRLKHRYIIAPMSNGNIALMTNMAKNGGLPWDCILGAEVAKHYKPDPGKLPDCGGPAGFATGSGDDDGGASGRPAGIPKGGTTDWLCTPAHGTRPQPHSRPDADPSFNVVATDFMDLAAQMGV